MERVGSHLLEWMVLRGGNPLAAQGGFQMLGTGSLPAAVPRSVRPHRLSGAGHFDFEEWLVGARSSRVACW